HPDPRRLLHGKVVLGLPTWNKKHFHSLESRAATMEAAPRIRMNHEHTRLSRRTFLAGSALLASGFARAQQASIPIIDTHIHFFDTTRPQGAPYPGPTKGP